MGGIFSFTGGKKQQEAFVQSEPTYKLTPDGEAKARALAGTENEFPVISALVQLGPAAATIREINEIAQIGESKVKHVLNQLIATKRVMKAGDNVS